MVLALTLVSSPTVFGQGYGDGSSMAERELEKRLMSLQEGQMLLEKGDEAYTAAKYEEAANAYAAAREAFVESPTTAELRGAATQRYVQASIEHARELVRKGDMEGAKAAVDKVLDESVAPNDPSALVYRAELDDPIRNNPALTKEHAADVDEVRRLLYTAQGAFDLGKFDQAAELYKDVLRIDPYNTAARRGMEQISAKKSSYYSSAQDHTRAEMLGMVDSAWELPLEADIVLPDLQEVTRTDSLYQNFVPLENKLSRMIIPEFNLDQGNLLEAIELLRLRASENDTFETDPAKKGINIAINLGDPDGETSRRVLAKTFDLRVSHVPVDQILKYITDITGTGYSLDDFAVTITTAGAGEGELTARTYRVPPDFLSNLATSGGGTQGEPADIFSNELGEGLLAERLGPQQALAQQGVTFPDGASAAFNAATNILRVVNTKSNLDIIEQIVDAIAQTEPVSVAVRVTMIKVEQSRLEELGFDWMLDNYAFGKDSWIPGASELNLSGGTVGNESPITDIAGIPGAIYPTRPITAGNRSGDGAILNNTIDSLINSATTGGTQTKSRAPGVLGVNAVVGGATVQALMRGLNQKTGVDLMAQPSVTTRSGQAASIYIVDEFIYPTEYEPPELPNSVGSGTGGSFPVTPATPTAFEKRDVGVVLEVLPVADANRRYVDVTLNPSVTDFDGFVNYGSPITSSVPDVFGGAVSQTITDNTILMPVFSTRRTNSNLWVMDGATIVIGGLMKDEITDVEDKTPILGDIPIVGRLFQSSAKKHRSTAILFLVNVELLDPTGRPYRDR
ncbi:MAG: Amuc_1098 family type IV pilus outer membrane protein [Luteolibacter sp.]